MDEPANSSSTTSSATKVINLSRSELSQRFQINGLNLRADALTTFESELKHGDPPYDGITEFINFLCEIMSKMSVENCFVDGDLAEKAVQLMRQQRPQLEFDSGDAGNSGTKIVPSSTVNSVVIKNITIDDDTASVDNRFSLNRGNFPWQIGQLTKSLVKLPIFQSGQYRLTTIDELNTYDSPVEMKAIVLALVRRDPSRIMQYLLEDSTGKVPAIFDQESTVWREWATFENGIYLIEGSYDGKRDLFAIQSIGLPPPVNDFLTVSTNPSSGSSKSTDSSMAIIVSEIYLNDSQTFEALKFLFTGYNSLDQVPELFVLVGDFVSKPVDQFDFKDHMKRLVKLISLFKRLAGKSRFVFVPGPNDFNENTETIFENQFGANHFPTTTNKIKNYYLATNPFYLQLQGCRNLCLYAEPVIRRMAKNVLNSTVSMDANQPKLFSKNDLKNENIEHFLDSIGRLMLSTGHLTTGQNRSFHNSLSLFPRSPDLILIRDSWFNAHHRSGPLYDNYNQSIRLSTMTSFSRDRFQFLVYYVEDNLLEESQITL